MPPTPHSPVQPVWSAQARARYAALAQAMPQAGDRLYGVLDAAIDDTLYDHLQAEPARSQVLCLYDGIPAIRYARYAPYLLRLHADSPLSAWWLEHGWAQHWGIFLSTPQPPEQVKRHLKKFLQTRYQGKPAYFRFYDPRVMAQWMPIFYTWQRGSFFNTGGATNIHAVMLAHDAHTVVRYTPQTHGLMMRMLQACQLQSTLFAAT